MNDDLDIEAMLEAPYHKVGCRLHIPALASLLDKTKQVETFCTTFCYDSFPLPNNSAFNDVVLVC